MNDSFYNETVKFTISASYLLSMFIHTCILPPVRHIQYHQYLPSVRHTDTLGSVLCPFWWWGVRWCTDSVSRSHSYTPWSCCSRSGRLSLPPPTHWCKTSSHTGGSLKNKPYFTSISRMDWCPNIVHVHVYLVHSVDSIAAYYRLGHHLKYHTNVLPTEFYFFC